MHLPAFCKSLPKIELHAHLNGSIREHTLVELANERNVELPTEFLLHEAEHHHRHQQRQHHQRRRRDDDPNNNNINYINNNNSKASHEDDDDNDDDDDDEDVLFFNTKPRNLQECFDIFAHIPKCVNDLVALRRIAREVLVDYARDNVAYVELRTGPKVLLRDHRENRQQHREECTKREYVETIAAVMREFEEEERERYRRELLAEENETNGNGNDDSDDSLFVVRLPLIPRLILSVDRSGTLDQANETIELAIELFRSGSRIIVGVELGGNPTRNDFRLFKPAFDIARKEGSLPIAIHCGEVPMGENEFETDPALRRAYEEAVSIVEFEPDRLGHALLFSDSLMETLLQRQQQKSNDNEKIIPIECCPTSNVMTLELARHHGGNLIDGARSHPQLGKWLEAGYPISINTDDSGLFCTDQTRELLLVAKAYDLGKAELGELVLGSVEHVFDPRGETKGRLRAELRRRIEELMAIA